MRKNILPSFWRSGSLNWRKPLLYIGLSLTSKVPEHLRELEVLENSSREKVIESKEIKLENLLLHAYKNVPYYTKIFSECGVIRNGKVFLENFESIPLLTKEIIRTEGENLYSKDLGKRKWYKNTSGGSTGEPVEFLQDNEYWDYNLANKLRYAQRVGKDLGQLEIKLWGSERDIFGGSETIKNRLTNFLYNRILLNSFNMSNESMANYVKIINLKKPVLIWSYVDSIYDLACFIERNNLEVYSPRSIVVTAGTLYGDMREKVESVFRTSVYNQYGSREFGSISCEDGKGGMLVFENSCNLESVNIDGQSEAIVTSLVNYSMPLIRFRIEDLIEFGDYNPKTGFGRIKNIQGKIMQSFKKKDGTLISGVFFTHFFYFRKWVKKFQVIQKDFDYIVINIVLNGEKNKSDMADMVKKTKFIFGSDCKVGFRFVDEITPSKSGKYLYTLSEIK